MSHAIQIFLHAVEAVKPSTLIHKHVTWQAPHLQIDEQSVKLQPNQRIFVIGAGKASALMAQTLEKIVGDRISGGIVVTKYDHGLPLNRIRLIEAAHPIPDGNSVLASEEILKLTAGLTDHDIVIFLLSGGASALLADFPEGSSLTEVQHTYDLLLKSGADIHEMNTVRKHLSNIKGGQLARHIHPARLFSLILSDVVGDDLDVIGSGPTAHDKSTFSDAYKVLEKYNLSRQVPQAIAKHIADGCAGKIPDTPKEGDTSFSSTHNFLIGSNQIALEAAAAKARELGYESHIISSTLNGEAKDLGKMIVQKAKEVKSTSPVCLLWGGEATVTIKGNGLGGRSMELALAAGIELGENQNITLLSAGTDGTDGPTDAAGAFVNAEIMKKAAALGLNANAYLENNDSYNFFSQAGGLIKTGATQTNVMDIMLALIDAE
ncbi:MAG: hypothetical protein K0S09_2295 [Sphingobacteriaceae bacterium]|jgi:hydroxypyruvate reductase|nr:hypothetical protein [Sphingobacteriaceae bacterium]